MPSRLLSIALCVWLLPAAARAGDLTLHDLVELHRAGLGDEVLLALIEVDGGPFDVDPGQLIALKSDGLSDRVVAALIRAGRDSASESDGEVATPADGRRGYGRAHRYGGTYLERVVAVPVHTLVPVLVPVGRTAGDAPPVTPPDVDRPFTSLRATQATSLGPRMRPGPVGAARATAGGRDAGAIGHVPPGFHPGTLGPRPSSSSGSEP